MDKLKNAVILLAGTFVFSSCVTLLGRKQKIYVNSYPQGASVYADEKYVGTTPCMFTKTDTFQKEFLPPLNIEGIYGGICCLPDLRVL